MSGNSFLRGRPSTNMKRTISSVLFFLIVFATAAAELPDFAKELRPQLEAKCFSCHGEKKQKGNVDFSGFSDTRSALKKFKLFRHALEQVESKQMPPEEEAPLAEPERAQLAAALKRLLAGLESEELRDPGPPLLRRLTRTEYTLTLRELTGLDFDAAQECAIPDDTPLTGFTTFAAAQNLTPALTEKYFSAADKIIERFKLAANDKDRRALNALFEELPGKLDERDAAKKFIAQFARRAFRRPATSAEIDALLPLYDAAVSKKEPFQKAALTMLKPVLVAPEFLFRLEKDGAAKAAHRISDVEFATRLSYFLWSSMPDETLLSLAEQNKLSDEKTLAEQLKRMLASPKARALTENFAAHWLQFRRVREARPNTEAFPAFNGRMREAMFSECATFFDRLREEDRSVLELLDADYTYVNEPLAKLYGVSGVSGEKFVRASLTPEQHRGGLLGMGAVLALTSHTDRTSPTQRGKWVLEVLLNDPPAPPPANAGQFKEDRKKKEPKNFREKLAQHANDATCAACHKKIDPLGFGLENFDAIGAWRPSGNGIEATGQLPGGEKFDGVAELKKIVVKRSGDFERGMIGQMLSYALGRELEYFDEREITKIQRALAANGHKFSTLVLGVATSYPFQNRRAE